MIKNIVLICSIMLFSSTALIAQEMNFYSFTVKNILGEDVSMSQFEGRKILVVNTASKCGLTPQYEELEDLYQEFQREDFVIIGFPANNFGSQEPGSSKEIAAFCQENYGVSFPMMAKISVKGDDQHELYQWLTQKAKNGVEDSEVTWNFQKYMISEEGKYLGMIAPKESPKSKVVYDFISKEVQ
ncbi:MAG: glutathione peroxidase [Flavobacteriales bacterium]|nr:glutathione peroxidase [Flavobacteriales bacterium]